MRPDIPTMLLMTIAASLTLSFAVGWVASTGHQKELKRWALALVLYTLSFILLGLRGRIPDLFSVILANILLTSVYGMLLSALVQFQRRHISRLFYVLPPFIAAAYSFFYANSLDARIIFFSLLSAAQIFAIFVVLSDKKYSVNGRGKQLLGMGLVLMLLAFVYRSIDTLSSPGAAVSLLHETPTQVITFLCSFCTLILTSVGFTLMIMERADERLRQIAMQDALTGIWNRARLVEAAQAEMARMQRYGHPVSLIMADLDRFKNINDTFGHSAGDMVLKQFSEVVHSCIRSTDIFGRWGGEEFLLLLPNTAYADSRQLAERIRRALEQHEMPGIGKISASFGFAVCQSADVWDTWLTRADMALYRAKARGRNCVEGEIQREDSHGIKLVGLDMIRLSWDEAYSSGHKKLDQQHEGLIESANGILKAMHEARPRREIQRLIEHFIIELKQHLDFEESTLRRYAYAELGEHSQHHSHLLARLCFLTEKYAQEQLDFRELYHFLSYEVVTQHMLNQDRRFFPLLASGLPSDD